MIVIDSLVYSNYIYKLVKYFSVLKVNPKEEQCLMKCLKLDDYYDLFYTGMMEFPALLISWYMVEKCGRTVTISLGFALSSLLTFSMHSCFQR